MLDDPLLTAGFGETDPQVVAPAAMPIFEGLVTTLLQLADRAPVMIGVDDVQHADPLSMQCIQYLIPRIRRSRICIVLTKCTAPCLADRQLHADILRQPNSRGISLTPLPQSAVTGLLSERLGSQATPGLADACFAASGGNPVLVKAFIDDCATSTSPEEAFGATFRFAVLSCLCPCNPTATSAAQALAVLGQPVPEALLAEILDVSVAAAVDATDSLQASGLLDEGWFRHEAAREAVLLGMDVEDRTALHAEAAQALYNHGAPTDTLASHLIAAHQVKANWAVAALQEAAELAIAENRITDALGYLRRALDGCDDDDQCAQLRLAFARTKWRADPANITCHLPELIDAAREGRLSDKHSIAVVNYSLWHGRIDDASEILTDLRTATDDPAAQLWVGYSYPELALQEQDKLAPIQEMTPASVRQNVVSEMLDHALRRQDDRTAVSLAEGILQRAHGDSATLQQVVSALAALILAEKQERAAFWCRILLREATAADAPLWRAMVEAIRAVIEIRQGDLPAAEQRAQAALNLLSAKGWGVAIGLPLAAIVLATTGEGKLDNAAAYLRTPVPEPMFHTTLAPFYLHARGKYYLTTNKLHAALADFLVCGDLLSEWSIDRPSYIPWRTDAAQVWLRMGRDSTARDLARKELDRIQPRHPRARGISLRVLGLASDPARRTQLLKEATEALRQSGDRLELAYALADLSRAHRELGENRRARTLAHQARHLAEQCHAELLKDTLPADVSTSQPSAPANPNLAALSAAEQRVATLAASDHTNQQISRKLRITVSTVEQHLTRVYRKLGVKCRADLPPQVTQPAPER